MRVVKSYEKQNRPREWNRCVCGGGLFGIITRDCQVGGASCVFGEVVEGLHVVAEAAQHRAIMEVTVADCGVVL